MSPSAETIIDFLSVLHEPDDLIEFRPIETWIEAERKRSRVLYKHRAWHRRKHLTPALLEGWLDAIGHEHGNAFFGVCPRFGAQGEYDQAWQIRTARVLWADVDHCTVEETLERVAKAGLPKPTIVISSGNGAHLYWKLAEAYQIDDAGEPARVVKKFAADKNGKNKPVDYIIVDGHEERLDAHNRPALSPKAALLQNTMKGMAAAIGADHTTDASRILRLPESLNRKNGRNGAEPKPSTLVSIDHSLAYGFDRFAEFAQRSPDKVKREAVEKIELKKPRKLTVGKQDKLSAYVNACRIAGVGERSEADFELCCYSIEEGISSDDAWSACSDAGKFAERGKAYFDNTWANAELVARERTYDKQITRQERKAERQRQSLAPDERPARVVIEYGPDEHRVVNEVIDALPNAPNIYQRGGVLVHVVHHSEPLETRSTFRPSGAPRLATLPASVLRTHITTVAEFTTIVENGESSYVKEIAVPEKIVNAVHAFGTWPGVRHIDLISDSPVLLTDGSVLQVPGYHPAGVLYQPGADFPEVPDHPTLDDAQGAAELLLDLIAEFPVATPAHRSVWLASLLTPIARLAFRGPAPLFGFEGNRAGAGKSLLSDIIAYLVTGCEFSRDSFTTDDNEMRKAILATAIEGERLLLFDNVEGELGCPALDRVLTAGTISGRILGTNQKVSNLPIKTTWYATGNNWSIIGDTVRRVCICRLETREENPEERAGFKYPDLAAHVIENRPQLLVAALTILRAWFANGCPNMRLKSWGSYEGWSRVVRNPIVWAGYADPGETRQEVREQADVDGNNFRALVTGWEQLMPSGAGITCAEVIDTLFYDSKFRDCYSTLKTAILELSNAKDGKPTPKQLSGVLRKFKRRVWRGKMFFGKPNRDGVMHWRVISTEAVAHHETDTDEPFLFETNGHTELPAGFAGNAGFVALTGT